MYDFTIPQDNMKFVGLLSGGKDSFFSVVKATRLGHKLACIASLYSHDEKDSSMFQTTGTLSVIALAKALGTPLITAPLRGKSLHQEMVYQRTEGDEIEDLFDLLTEVKYRYPEVEAVVNGAVFSNYQRLRIEDVCARLGLVSIAPLWRLDQSLLLQEEVDAGIDAVVVKVSSMGLTEEHLGRSVKDLIDHFAELSRKFGFNVCGEGGEYETVVVDAPELTHKIVLSDTEILSDRKSDIASSATMKIGKFELEHKESGVRENVQIPSAQRILPKLYKTISHFTTGELTASSFGYTECRNIEDEAFVLLRGVKELFQANGVKLEDIYYVNATLKDLADFVKFNQVYKSFFGRPGPPSRCCVETKGQECRVKLALRGSNYKKSSLHVQSISHWAPANVGPYSQATEVQGRLHMAGAIPLVPSTMQLAPEQLSQCLTNLQAISETMKYDLNNTELTVVYYAGDEKPEVPVQFRPFYIHTTRIPKDSKLEIEMHLKKSLPVMQMEEIEIQGAEFQGVIRKHSCAEVLYATFQVTITSCSNPESLLEALKGHLDAYYQSVQHKSPTLEEELMSTAQLHKTILDYVTEVRVAVPNPLEYRSGWLTQVPTFYISSASSSLLICLEDTLQLNTFDFIQATS